MAGQTVEVGNAIIVLAGDNDPFSDGRTTGYLEFYNERHRPRFPLSSQVIHDYLALVMDEPSTPTLWKARRINGWMEALIENCPQTFRSLVPEGHMTVLQKA